MRYIKEYFEILGIELVAIIVVGICLAPIILAFVLGIYYKEPLFALLTLAYLFYMPLIPIAQNIKNYREARLKALKDFEEVKKEKK